MLQQERRVQTLAGLQISSLSTIGSRQKVCFFPVDLIIIDSKYTDYSYIFA